MHPSYVGCFVNHGHNILELLNIFKKFEFTKSKAVVAIYYKKYCIRVASQVAELLQILALRKLGKIIKMSKLGGD